MYLKQVIKLFAENINQVFGCIMDGDIAQMNPVKTVPILPCFIEAFVMTATS